MKTQILISLKIFALLTVVFGVVYPLLITGVAQLAFPEKANGSLIVQGNKVVGSELIGQKFDREDYFWSRPSATDCSSMPSGGSNLGQTSAKLQKLVADRTAQWKTANQLTGSEPIPSEMLLTSASGIDPHISPKAALMQVDRIARVRQFSDDHKQLLIRTVNELAEAPQFSVLGENRINVLVLNIALDKLDGKNLNHQ